SSRRTNFPFIAPLRSNGSLARTFLGTRCFAHRQRFADILLSPEGRLTNLCATASPPVLAVWLSSPLAPEAGARGAGQQQPDRESACARKSHALAIAPGPSGRIAPRAPSRPS